MSEVTMWKILADDKAIPLIWGDVESYKVVNRGYNGGRNAYIRYVMKNGEVHTDEFDVCDELEEFLSFHGID